MTRYISLRNRTPYSLREGALDVGFMVRECVSSGMPAIAITDRNNLFGALEFSEKCVAAGIQPIIGMITTLSIQNRLPEDRNARSAKRGSVPDIGADIVLLAQDETGLDNLRKLTSIINFGTHLSELDDPGRDLSRLVREDDLACHAAGLICLTGGPDGPAGQLLDHIGQAGMQHWLSRMHDIFPQRLYVELQRHVFDPDIEDRFAHREEITEGAFLDAATTLELPVVATNDAHFRTPEDYHAHDAFRCLGREEYIDKDDRDRLTPDHYFKTESEMTEIFRDIPEALDATVEIARRCAARFKTADPILPRFSDDEVRELRRQAAEGLRDRLLNNPWAVDRQTYIDRLKFELRVIESMGFPGYFLIVADFVKWAKSNGIPVGPGRGSGAGSLVAWALTITDLDPLRFDLLFERFLNPDRISMPDFDIDFCMDRRDEVIDYVQRTYGTDKVGQIITFGGFLSRTAIREIGRVMQIPYPVRDRLSKLIPMDGATPMSIKDARDAEPMIDEEARSDPKIDQLLGHSSRVDKCLNNASTHAAGVVIGDRPLDDLVPICKLDSEMPVSQFNMKWVEAAGLVKFDFLGLKTLTVIKSALDMISERGETVTTDAISFDDAATLELYRRAETVGVFQVESSGMMDALRKMKPTCIEDIIALVALYRPGPMENIDQYCDVKNGLAERIQIHPFIDGILDETQGIIVYQEQVMQIAREMAGYSLSQADLLRRAMGKKIQSAMDAERPKFIEGAKAKGVDEAKAVEVWNLLDKFANYGFNKSHAAAYAVVSYQTAWLKANHPVEFFAALMNGDIRNTDKLVVFQAEARRMGVDVLPPCINRSQMYCAIEIGDDGVSRIRYGLVGIKGVGPDCLHPLLEGRQEIEAVRGPGAGFRDAIDLAQQVNLKKIGSGSLKRLIQAGALDGLSSEAADRGDLHAAVPALIGYSDAIERESDAATGLLFDTSDVVQAPALTDRDPWSFDVKLSQELEVLGVYVSGHPLDAMIDQLVTKNRVTQIHNIRTIGDSETVRIAGVVHEAEKGKTKKGGLFLRLRISDPEGSVTALIFYDTASDLQRAGISGVPGERILITGVVRRKNDEISLIARSYQQLDQAITDTTRNYNQVRIQANDDLDPPMLAARLMSPKSDSIKNSSGSGTEVLLDLRNITPPCTIRLGDNLTIDESCLDDIRSIPGVIAVQTA